MRSCASTHTKSVSRRLKTAAVFVRRGTDHDLSAHGLVDERAGQPAASLVHEPAADGLARERRIGANERTRSRDRWQAAPFATRRGRHVARAAASGPHRSLPLPAAQRAIASRRPAARRRAPRAALARAPNHARPRRSGSPVRRRRSCRWLAPTAYNTASTAAASAPPRALASAMRPAPSFGKQGARSPTRSRLPSRVVASTSCLCVPATRCWIASPCAPAASHCSARPTSAENCGSAARDSCCDAIARGYRTTGTATASQRARRCTGTREKRRA